MKPQRITRLVALVAMLLCGPQLTHAAGNAIENDWAAIEHCLGIIRQCQTSDGMIRMKGDGGPVWTVPYFSNFAAIALLAANDAKQNRQDVARAERWLIWYARHQESDGTIYDREGTTLSYKSNGKRDATDSYAATFLMATWRYKRAIRQRPSPEITGAARKSLSAIQTVVQNDGLTIAKPEYAIKYLMDNIEVYQGLMEGALFFDSVGMDKESQNTRKMAARIAESLGKYWFEQDQHFGYALDMKGKLSTGLSKSYPHGLAQLFALSYVRPTRPRLWTKVNQTFTPNDKGVPIERWLIAAIRHAGPKELEDLRRATRKAALRFSTKEVYVERPAMAVIALLDGKARFADVPAFRKK